MGPGPDVAHIGSLSFKLGQPELQNASNQTLCAYRSQWHPRVPFAGGT